MATTNGFRAIGSLTIASEDLAGGVDFDRPISIVFPLGVFLLDQ